MLFHTLPGRWLNVDHMRSCLSSLEWHRHLAYLKPRIAGAKKAAAQMQKQAKAGRR